MFRLRNFRCRYLFKIRALLLVIILVDIRRILDRSMDSRLGPVLSKDWSLGINIILIRLKSLGIEVTWIILVMIHKLKVATPSSTTNNPMLHFPINQGICDRPTRVMVRGWTLNVFKDSKKSSILSAVTTWSCDTYRIMSHDKCIFCKCLLRLLRSFFCHATTWS